MSPLMLSWSRFCYLDTEYVRPDYWVAPVDKFAVPNVELYSIQYSTMKLRRSMKMLPKLKVLQRDPDKSELDILIEFWPTWKCFFGNVKRKGRLIPFGFVVTADLQILAKKYQFYQKEISIIDPDATEKHFNPFHVLQISRFLDLQWPFQLKHGLIDISLHTMSENLNNKDTKVIIQELLRTDIETATRVRLNEQFHKYVTEEYQAVMEHSRIILRKMSGIFRPPPSIKSIPKRS